MTVGMKQVTGDFTFAVLSLQVPCFENQKQVTVWQNPIWDQRFFYRFLVLYLALYFTTSSSIGNFGFTEIVFSLNNKIMQIHKNYILYRHVLFNLVKSVFKLGLS